jgi:hypothetical protein
MTMETMRIMTLAHPTIRRTIATVALAVLGVVGLPAMAEAASPAFSISSTASPSRFVAGDNSGRAQYQVTFTNTSSFDTDGSAVTMTATIPPGLTLNPAGGGTAPSGIFAITETGGGPDTTCDPGPPVVCVTGLTHPIHPGESRTVFISVNVDAGAPSMLTSHVSVSGGGAAAASSIEQTPVSSAAAAFGFQALDTSFTDAAGSPETRAGAHPYAFRTGFQVNSISDPVGNNPPAGTLKDVAVKLPPGMVVNPNATPVRCTESQLRSRVGIFDASACPDASAVGIVRPTIGIFGFANPGAAGAIYNMVPPPGVPAELAFDAAHLGIYVHLLGGVDAAGKYQLTADAKDIPQYGVISGTNVDLWGDPSDPSHDYQRGKCEAVNFQGSTCPVSPDSTPLLTMPSACSNSLAVDFSVDSWEDPGNYVSAAAPTRDTDGNPIGVTGCSQLDFDPTLTAALGTTSADSSSALDVSLQVPQSDDPEALAEANLKSAKVTLPAGMAVNPSSADGLDACSPAQIGIGTKDEPTCPDASKVGTVEVDTPLLDGPLEGSVYLAKQNENPFSSLLALYITAERDGALIKLAGKVDPDPLTGRLTATFADNPQLPFSSFKLHFKGGNRAPLVSPPSCGTYEVQSELSPWSAADPDHPTAAEVVHTTDSFQITSGPGGGPCPDLGDPGRFTPEFSAGTVTPSAGLYSPFVLKVSRPDGQQSLKKIAVTLPLGLTAKLAGVPRCPQSAIVPGVGGSTSCPAGSQVGTVTVGAGAGATPFFLQNQPVYLTDGYDGAPFGLAIDTHALAGPLDLGHVVVRTKLSIDPITTQVSADAEPLPTIIQGIPLHIRSVTLKMDRNTFVLNPTSCDAQTVAGQITGAGSNLADPADDLVKSVSSPFQVGGCSNLALSPNLAISLTGKGQTTDNKHPGVSATVTQTPGQANLKKVRVALPLSLALDPDNANGLCEFTDGSKVDPTCPKASVVGTATATTPILDQPLTGPVYFVKNIRKDPKSGRDIRTLPKLVIPLTGENGVRLNLVGTSNVENNRLVTTFDNIPDAPVSGFKLNIIGGKGGILVVSGTDICKSTQVAAQQVDGQNGKTADANVYLQTPACPLKIISKKVGKTSVAIKIGGLGAGKVTVSGKGIKKTSKTIAKSTVATITAKRTKGKPGKVTVSFDPTGPAKAHKTTK